MKDDFSVDDDAFQDLLATLFNVKIKSKPKLGEMPESFKGRTSSEDDMNIQDIKNRRNNYKRSYCASNGWHSRSCII